MTKKLLLLPLVLLVVIISTSCFGCSKVDELTTENNSKYLNIDYTVEKIDNKYLFHITISPTDSHYVFKNTKINFGNGDFFLPESGNYSFSITKDSLNTLFWGFSVSGVVYK